MITVETMLIKEALDNAHGYLCMGVEDIIEFVNGYFYEQENFTRDEIINTLLAEVAAGTWGRTFDKAFCTTWYYSLRED